MDQLNRTIFNKHSRKIILPAYKLDEHASGIVHIGIGAFHKAHQAVYTDDALNKYGGDWRITAVSLRNPTARDQLAPQDNLYTVIERGDDSTSYRVIGAIEKVLVAPENPSVIIELLAHPTIKIVTITITEKGYCQINGSLDLTHPDIQHDLQHPTTPRTMAGFIVAGCALRRQKDLPGLTIISCDNLAHNGQVTRNTVLHFAEQCDPSLAEWIKNHLGFCSTMVDRIVPATTEQDIDSLKEYLGVDDQAAVVCEPFRQWVIENNFCTERPRWDEVGVMIMDNVTFFEKMKLRLLNGSHSTLAYIGFLMGYEYIYQAIADPVLYSFIEKFMDEEVTSTLYVPPGFDLDIYKATIRKRFANSQIPYKTMQVANDGSQKLPQRLCATAIDLLNKNQPLKFISFIMAAWIRFLSGKDEMGHSFDIKDPKAFELMNLAGNIYSGEVHYKKLSEILAIVSPKLIEHREFVDSVASWLAGINEMGIKATLEKCLKLTSN